VNVFENLERSETNMAKKKTRKGKKTQQRRRDLKVTPKDVEKGKEAIKTMVVGMAILSLFMIFFAFDIGGETLFERIASIFSSTPEKP
jgi:hypothetical protein